MTRKTAPPNMAWRCVKLQDTMFVATHEESRDAVAATLPPSRATSAAAATASVAAAAGAVAGPGLVDTTQEVSYTPTADLPRFTQFVFPNVSATSCVSATAAAAGVVEEGRAGEVSLQNSTAGMQDACEILPSVGSASSSTGLLTAKESGAAGAARAAVAAALDRPTVGPPTSNQMLFLNGWTPLAAEAAPAAPAPVPALTPAGGSAVALLDPTPRAPSMSNHQHHAYEPSVNTFVRLPETVAKGCGGARAAPGPVASTAEATTSPAFMLPYAPFPPPESYTSLESSSKPSASSIACSTASLTSVAFESAAAMPMSDGSDTDVKNKRQHESDDEVRGRHCFRNLLSVVCS